MKRNETQITITLYYIYVVSFSYRSVGRKAMCMKFSLITSHVYIFPSVPNHWDHSFYSNYDHIHNNIEFIVVITIITITV